MDDFDAISDNLTTGHFEELAKIVASWTEQQRTEYADRFSPAIWMQAGPSEDMSFLISAN